jgi:hypothetical protein
MGLVLSPFQGLGDNRFYIRSAVQSAIAKALSEHVRNAYDLKLK